MTLFYSPDMAMQASIEMLGVLEGYNQDRKNRQKLPVRVGIGLNFGLMMLGTVGGKTRMDSTVISDAVNLTSRVEELTKNYHVSLLASEQVISRLEDPSQFFLRKIDRVQVKGKSEKVVVYEVFNADPSEVKDKKLAAMDIFNEAYTCFFSDKIDEARKLFQECHEKNQDDTVAKVYLERCDRRQ